MTAIVLTMAANGTLTWELSAAIVLGSNIGSTIDAVMSSFGATVNARRTAMVHVGFNVAGTLIALIVFRPFLSFVDFIVPGIPSENITTHIAMLHTIFNISATLLFVPFVDQIALLATRLIRDDKALENEHYKASEFTGIVSGKERSNKITDFIKRLNIEYYENMWDKMNEIVMREFKKGREK